MRKGIFGILLICLFAGYGKAADVICIPEIEVNNTFDSYEILDNGGVQVIRIFLKSGVLDRSQLGTDIVIDGSKFVELIMARLLQISKGEKIQYTPAGSDPDALGFEWYYFDPILDTYTWGNFKGIAIGRKLDDVKLKVYLNPDVDGICKASFLYDKTDPLKQLQFDYMFSALIEPSKTIAGDLKKRLAFKRNASSEIVGIVMGDWGKDIPAH